MTKRKIIKTKDCVIVVCIIILSFFSQLKCFDLSRLSIHVIWIIMGLLSAAIVLIPVYKITKNTLYLIIAKILFLFLYFLSGMINGEKVTVVPNTIVLIMIFLTCAYLSRTDIWYDFFFRSFTACAMVYSVAAILQLFWPELIAIFTEKMLSSERFEVNQFLVEHSYYVGIASQASYQVHFVLPLLAFSFSKVVLSKKMNATWLALLGISIMALLISNKRMPILAALISAVFCLCLMNNNLKTLKRSVPLVLAGGAFVIVVLESPYGEQVLNRLIATTTVDNTRYELWDTALKLWHQYPLFGSGAGSFGRDMTLSVHNSISKYYVNKDLWAWRFIC